MPENARRSPKSSFQATSPPDAARRVDGACDGCGGCGGFFGGARSSKRGFIETIFLWLVPAAAFLGVFWSSFDDDARFSYRDVAYFYYPLFEQIQNEWDSGRLPLWDPFENLGQPLAGNPAAAVFYPGKAVFFLSSFDLVDFATCFKIYLYAHLGTAFFGVYFLTRRLKISRAGAIFSGTSYAFSGQILFQYSNVIYLVGAAWLPWIFLFAFDFFAKSNLKRKFFSAFKLSVVEALAILGGEPQIVYLATVALGFFALVAPTRLTVATLPTFRPLPPSPSLPPSPTFRPLPDRKRFRVLLGGIFLVGVATATSLCAAIQILPSLETIRRSERSIGATPRSLWEIPAALSQRKIDSETTQTNVDFYSGLLCDDIENRGQSRSTYRFSVGPWRWAEYVFPNVGGRQFPQASRWFSVFPEEVAVWTPTLYFGIVPFLAALSAMRFRRRRDASEAMQTDTRQAFRRWTSWLVAVAAFGALGGYGAVWAFRFLRDSFGGGAVSQVFQNGDPIGGVYWLLDLTLPKFVEFRYPAKLLTLSAVGLSVLAGFGWDEEKFSRRFRATSGVVFAVAVAGWIVVSIRGESPFATIRTVDPLYGPFQPRLAFETVRGALAQTAFVLATATAILFFWEKNLKTNDGKRLTRKNFSAICSVALLASTAIDVGVANSWTITTTSNRFFEPRGEILQTVENERLLTATRLKSDFDPRTDAAPPIRVYRFPVWFPASFQQKSTPTRTSERVLWDALTLFPKYPFFNGIATIDARGTASDAEYAAFVDGLATRTKIDADAAFLDVSYLVGPQEITSRLSAKKSVETSSAARANLADSNAAGSSVAVAKVAATPNRVWLFRDGRPDRRPGERAEIVAFEPNRIVYFLETNANADVVFAEQFWPDWTATAIPLESPEEKTALLDARFDADATRTFCRSQKTRSFDVPVEKAFRFLRKVSVPNGTYCVVLTYRPRLFYLGATISGASWTLAAIILATIFFRRRNRRRKFSRFSTNIFRRRPRANFRIETTRKASRSND